MCPDGHWWRDSIGVIWAAVQWWNQFLGQINASLHHCFSLSWFHQSFKIDQINSSLSVILRMLYQILLFVFIFVLQFHTQQLCKKYAALVSSAIDLSFLLFLATRWALQHESFLSLTLTLSGSLSLSRCARWTSDLGLWECSAGGGQSHPDLHQYRQQTPRQAALVPRRPGAGRLETQGVCGRSVCLCVYF